MRGVVAAGGSGVRRLRIPIAEDRRALRRLARVVALVRLYCEAV